MYFAIYNQAYLRPAKVIKKDRIVLRGLNLACSLYAVFAPVSLPFNYIFYLCGKLDSK